MPPYSNKAEQARTNKCTSINIEVKNRHKVQCVIAELPAAARRRN